MPASSSTAAKLASVISTYGFDSQQSFAELRNYNQTGQLGELCEYLLENPAHLARVVEQSFLHAGGIYKLVLHRTNYSEPEVRLHIWETGDKFPENTNYDSIHNHRWDFSSLVVSGTFRKTLLVGTNDPHGFHKHYQFIAGEPGEMNRVHELGMSKLVTMFSCELSLGCAYGLSHNALHILHPTTASFSATLFIRQPYTSDRTDVYLPKNAAIQDAQSSGLTRIAPERVANFLKRFSDAPHE